MFVIQRVLESEGKFTLLDKNKVLQQHDLFRIFRNDKHCWSWRYNWIVPWYSTNQPGSDG